MSVKDLTPEERRLIGKTLVAFKHFWNAHPRDEVRAVEAWIDSVIETAKEMEKVK